MEKVKIAVLGFGTIGKGVYEVMDKNRAYVTSNSGKVIEISKILVRDVEKNTDELKNNDVFVTNIDNIINDDSIQIVVELMGGEQPATDFMLMALNAGKSVVTANKLAVATNGEQLISTAREKHVHFEYEASVGGGIPIIRLINESFNANKAESIVGIINGTSNYILTKMSKEGMDFGDALKIAQQKGYAEADPTSDIGGYDTLYKLSIMSSLAFSTEVDLHDIYREGIENISKQDIEYAKRFGYVIKLLAIAKEIDKKLELRVHPTMIPSDHAMANINNAYNAIYITGNAVDDIMISGKGAGAHPTASAVVSDIISIVKSAPIIEGVGIPKRKLPVIPIEETSSRYYINLNVQDVVGVLADITSIFSRNKVNIYSVTQDILENNTASAFFITHLTQEKNLQNAIEEIKKLSTVNNISSIIRIEKLDQF